MAQGLGVLSAQMENNIRKLIFLKIKALVRAGEIAQQLKQVPPAFLEDLSSGLSLHRPLTAL